MVKPLTECLLAVDSAVSAKPMRAAIEEAFTIEFGVIVAAWMLQPTIRRT
ncbi:hypothetical protein [Burkholderia cenocepacia]|nr:hypothetical protein [Burkholderia cenocepacia]